MDIQAYVHRAQAAIKDGEFDLAERYFQQILSQFPYNQDALEGLKALEVARAKKRWNVVVWAVKVWLAQLQVMRGKAEAVHDQVVLLHQVRPQSVWAGMVWAACAEKRGQLEEAHRALKHVLHLDPNHAKALEKDAEILIHLDRLEDAEKRMQRLVSLRPQDDKLAHRLRDISAKAYAKVGIPEDLQARRRQIEKEKLEAIGTPEFMERLEKLQKAYEARPDQAEQGVAVAAHYRSGELYDLANRVLGSILDQDPNCEAARREQARVWRQSGDLQIAAQLYEELIEAYPDDLLLRDEYLDAKIAYGEARWAETGKDRQVWNDLQKMRLEREKNRMAYLRQFLRERPEAFEERAEMGELLIRHGQIEEAIPYVQRLVHELPFAAKGYFLLGQCFLAKGDQALAIVQYEKSIEYFKNRGYSHIPSEDLKTVYYHLGIAKENCGDVAGAREAYGMVYAADIHFKDIRERYEKTFR